MWRLVWLLLISGMMLPVTAVTSGGRTLHLGYRDFSFSIAEPEGWSIDFHSALQIANFVAHPKGSSWRESDVAIFGRFFRRPEDQTLEQFLEADTQAFQDRCPFYEIRDPGLELKDSRRFLAKEIHCPGLRYEVIAVTETPHYFVTFVLSSNRPDRMKAEIPAFQVLLSSFAWFSQSAPAFSSGQAGSDP